MTALTDLFRDVGGALDANRAVVADAYGPAAGLDLARALHEEVDDHGARILKRYCEHRRLDALVAAAVAAASPDKNHPATPGPPADPRAVEEYLEEVLVLYQRCEEYNQYLLAAMADAVAPDPLGPTREHAFRSGDFNVTVRELVSHYINLVCCRGVWGTMGRAAWSNRRRTPPPLQEEFYAEQNVRTAVDIDDWTPGAPLTSMVDDVFFIVQKCGRRALATGNVQCACAVLTAGNGLLASDLKAALDAKWKVGCLDRDAPHGRKRGASRRRAAALRRSRKRRTRPLPHTQPAALRLSQLLGAALDGDPGTGDEAAGQTALFNNVDASAQ